MAADATRRLARQAGRVEQLAGAGAPRVRDRSRAANRRLLTLNRTLARRTGQGKQTGLRLTAEAGDLVRRWVAETRRLARRLRARARGRGAPTKLAAARRLEELAERADTVARQIRQRAAGAKISDGLVSLSDPDARPIRKGKLGAPAEFGYVFQITELTENTRRARAACSCPPRRRSARPISPTCWRPPASSSTDSPSPRRRSRSTAAWPPAPVAEHLPASRRTFIAGRQGTGSRRSDRRLARYRVGADGRISHLKRRYGLGRSRLKGHEGAQTWVAWGILAYNLDTPAIRTA